MELLHTIALPLFSQSNVEAHMSGTALRRADDLTVLASRPELTQLTVTACLWVNPHAALSVHLIS